MRLGPYAVAASAACLAAIAAGEVVAQPPPVPDKTVETDGAATHERHAQAWESAYREAVVWMKQGRYYQAEAQFAYLAATGPRAEDCRAALQMRAICAQQSARQRDGPQVPRPTSQRTTDEIALLYTHAVLFGLGAGFVVAQLREPTNAMEYTLPTLASIGAATSAVAVLDAGEPLGFGVGQALAAGSQLGFAEGIAIVSVAQARVARRDEWSTKTSGTFVLGTAAAGAVVGGLAGSELEATPGQASFVASTAIWSGVLGGAFGASLAGADRHDQNRTGSLSGWIGINAGIVVGALAAGPVSPSPDRMRFVDLGGLLGLLTGLGAYAIAGNPGDSGDSRALYGAAGATTASGLTIAWFATAGMPAQARPSTHPVVRLQPTVLSTSEGLTLGVSGSL